MVTRKISDIYTLNKSRRTLRQIYRLYQKKERKLDSMTKERFQSHLLSLQTAILQKDANIASRIASQLEESAKALMPRTIWDKVRDFTGALLFALLIAVVIRTMWFELYTIPTGSMRPTLKEGDFLVVSKTDYGINVPLSASHFYFDPSLVKRGGVFVFTGKNMDIHDADTTYFYLFPGKKQFVKRLIGKPGDTLYFYGGEIYGINAQGEELKDLRDPAWFRNLEHIPFIRFDGKVETPRLPEQGVFHSTLFYQMNQPIAQLSVSSRGVISGEMLGSSNKSTLSNYSDLWGFKNFAMARLLTSSQVSQMYPDALKNLSEGVLYLELTHHPSLHGTKLIRDEMQRIRPDLGSSVSLLPLNQKNIDTIADHMLTCRFIVEKGVAYRYGFNPKNPSSLSYLPKLSDVPDGTYEIQNGKAYSILSGGITKELKADHPLYRKDPERVQLLYNLGIEFITYYSPSKNNPLYPSRYAYFRGHDLYLLGAPIVKKEDPELTLFLQREYQKQSQAKSNEPYFPFDDAGPPLLDNGKIDAAFIRKYGLVVPEKMYLALGDNHAMSSDSRQFGFVPEDNIRGGVSFLFWPPGSRWGQIFQPIYPHLTFPNLFVWISALSIGFGSSFYRARKFNRPLKFRQLLKKS
jgi:signal peptidase I